MNATPDRIVNETSSSGPKPPSYGAPSKHAQRKGSHLLMAKRGKGSMTIQSVNTHAVPQAVNLDSVEDLFILNVKF